MRAQKVADFYAAAWPAFTPPLTKVCFLQEASLQTNPEDDHD